MFLIDQLRDALGSDATTAPDSAVSEDDAVVASRGGERYASLQSNNSGKRT